MVFSFRRDAVAYQIFAALLMLGSIICTPVWAQSSKSIQSPAPPALEAEPVAIGQASLKLDSILVTIGGHLGYEHSIHEYDERGNLRNSILLPRGKDRASCPHDVVVGDDGYIHIYRGTLDARIASWNPTNGLLYFQRTTALQKDGNTTRGAMAALGPYVYAVAEATGGKKSGITRFDTRDRSVTHFSSPLPTIKPVDLAGGLDGHLYALLSDARNLQRIDGATMKPIKALKVPGLRSFTVDQTGRIIASGQDDHLYVFSPSGMIIAKSRMPVPDVHDLNVDENDRVAMAIGSEEVGVTTVGEIGRSEPRRFKTPTCSTMFVAFVRRPTPLGGTSVAQGNKAKAVPVTVDDSVESDASSVLNIMPLDHAEESDAASITTTAINTSNHPPARPQIAAVQKLDYARGTESQFWSWVSVFGFMGLCIIAVMFLIEMFRFKAPSIPDALLASFATSKKTPPAPLPLGVRAIVQCNAYNRHRNKMAWELALFDNRVILRNQDHQVVADIPANELHARLTLPGNTTGTRHFTIHGDTDICLFANKRNLKLLTAYVTYSMVSAGREVVDSVRSTGWREIGIGLCMFTVGALITGLTMMYASGPKGGYYMVCYGAIGVGLATFAKGVASVNRAGAAKRRMSH